MTVCDWVYFATPSQEDWTITRGIVDELKMIIRTAYNTKGIPIANVKNLHIGDRILLVYGGGRSGQPYRPIFSCKVVPPPRPIPQFEAMTFADASQSERLRSSNYPADPYLNQFTGISIEVSEHLERLGHTIQKPGGNNVIRRWSDVFPAPAQLLSCLT